MKMLVESLKRMYKKGTLTEEQIEFAERAKVSRTTLEGIVKKGIARDDVCEKIYAYAYNNKYRINSVKEELIKEKYRDVLFHGSKKGLSEISISDSRENCDFV